MREERRNDLPAGVPELLAPAGSLESLRAAVSAGADAVYMGGLRFGARAYAENADDTGLLEALDHVHLRGKRLYLTVNTLLKEHELEDQLEAYLEPLYRHGLDAVIVQDPGVLAFVRERFPGMEIHASTQMAVTSIYGARLLADRGICRVILPRELSLEEIREISKGPVKTEVFVHGALCYSYSGQCLMSSLIGGRSGNRGRCAQACRLAWPKDHLLNLKDLCALPLLDRIAEAGVSSLKIEGRMKSPLYTAGITSVYRKYLDLIASGAPYRVDPADIEAMRTLFDRGGFTDGYFTRHNGADMIYKGEKPRVRVPDETVVRSVTEKYLERESKVKIHGKVRICTGEPVTMTVTCRGITAEAAGPEVPRAQNRPLTRAEAERSFGKLGGSDYIWETLDIDLSENAFLPVGAMNALRREALEMLTKELLRVHYRTD